MPRRMSSGASAALVRMTVAASSAVVMCAVVAHDNDARESTTEKRERCITSMLQRERADRDFSLLRIVDRGGECLEVRVLSRLNATTIDQQLLFVGHDRAVLL